jgi:hypothetical protein
MEAMEEIPAALVGLEVKQLPQARGPQAQTGAQEATEVALAPWE